MHWMLHRIPQERSLASSAHNPCIGCCAESHDQPLDAAQNRTKSILHGATMCAAERSKRSPSFGHHVQVTKDDRRGEALLGSCRERTFRHVAVCMQHQKRKQRKTALERSLPHHAAPVAADALCRQQCTTTFFLPTLHPHGTNGPHGNQC